MPVAALAEVLPWLHPRDVAALACTCSALAIAAASLTRLRVSDAACGRERWRVPIINTVDHVLYPFFSYFPVSLFRPVLPLRPWAGTGSDLNTGKAAPFGQPVLEGTDNCPCFAFEFPTENLGARCNGLELDTENVEAPSVKKSRLQTPLCGRTLDGELVYNDESRLCCLTTPKNDDDPTSNEFFLIMECGPACSCCQSCKYRVTQHGLAVKLAVFRDHLKGWGLRAMEFISKGSFAFEYAGELLTTLEAQNRQKGYDERQKTDKKFVPSLLVLREHLPSGGACLRLNIDATQVGNVARFVNHSCDGGNLFPCLVRLSGCFIPKLVFFARRDILEGEELTFSYGDTTDGLQGNPCFCKTAACKGILPFEET